MWYVYILECKNGALYTGITKNLDQRLQTHQTGRGGHFTKAFGARRILYSESYPDRSSSLKREAEIKRWPRDKKLGLTKNV